MMTIEEFLNDFTKTHNIQKTDKLNGTIISAINDEYYLVNTEDIKVK